MAGYNSDPLQSFRFLVRTGDSDQISAAFTSVSGIKMDVETIENRFGEDIRGVKEYMPVLTKFSPITLSGGVVGDNAFLDWVFSTAAGEYSGPTGVNMRRTLEIVSLNQYGQPGVVWILKNAMPTGYSLSELNSKSGEVLMESLTVSYTGITRRTEMGASSQPGGSGGAHFGALPRLDGIR